ncbi:hypothetical protein U5801_25850 [Lamprobacter modestohalophilus]|uniref:hypothetical protein n=1 Tax=Lamprobacter modestohalophilus TaxID=1064514 RepID=UPI002ADEEF73|nr:hypothetical protein [Lamprobacter modestohalophilus]MCF7979854.1 hypothetical protein [Chromatiaceae bacterium]MCF7996957.1 hypothetical protein [Chromatiaceae bacterium]MCF8016606.1 hypothetical protein [Chromatiaceae bacterium]MEA1053205.1 hypothetical protein [Lamprobacter modestohalophilus]
MALAQQDLEQIGEYVKDHISDWIAEQSLGKPPVVYEIELRERMVRVEEELKTQRELMREGFNTMRTEMNLRFEQVDKRFEQVDKRFEQVDKRFESVQQDIRGLQQRMDSFMRWSFGVTIGTGGLIVGILKFWP